MRMNTLPGCFWLRLSVESRVRIKQKLTLSPVPVAKRSLPNSFVMLQSQDRDVFPTVERRATVIARNDTMVLVSLSRDGRCSHLVYALTVNSTADTPPCPLALRGCLWREGVGFPPQRLPCQEFPPEHFTLLFPLHFILPSGVFPCSLSLWLSTFPSFL